MQTTLFDTPNVISSPESLDGPSPCVSPDGQTTNQSGQARVPANRSPKPGKASAKTTRATSGLRFGNSSPSAALTSSLVSRLRERLDCDGSLEYKLTWRKIRTDWGLRSYALRASARPISGNGCSGWPTQCGQDGPKGGPNQGVDRLPGAAALAGWGTPRANDGTGDATPPGREGGIGLKQQAALCGSVTPNARDWKSEAGSENNSYDKTPNLSRQVLVGWATPNVPNGGRSISHAEMKGATAYHDGKKVQIGLEAQARMAGWVSPTATDGQRGNLPPRPHDTGVPLDQMAALAGWPTPMAGSPATETYNAAGNNDFSRKVVEVTPSGPTSTSSTASTEKRGALNPDFSRWLMGYPVEWLFAAPVKKSTGIRGQARSGDSATPSCPK